MRIAVFADSSVVVTLPFGFAREAAENYFKEKFNWVLKSLNYFKKYKHQPLIKSGRREYLKHKILALSLAKVKVEQWNKIYSFNYHRVNIKNQKTRWGSCSKKGNLNFNYKIVHLPETALDYLVIHELCHLKEFNHSQNFWALVAQAVPDYKKQRQALREFIQAPSC